MISPVQPSLGRFAAAVGGGAPQSQGLPSVVQGQREQTEWPRFGTNGFYGAKTVLLSPAVKFAGTLNEDYHVELRVGEPVNPETTSAIMRTLLIRHMLKKEKGDTSTLKLFLDGSHTNSFIGTSRAALADMLALVNRPVDIIVKENVSNEGLMALLSATGKRLMYEGAYITMGPVNSGAPHMRNDDHAVRREFQNDYVRDLEALIMQKAGVDDRKEVYYEGLNRAKPLNSLESLYYGKHGLVDGVLVGFDQVVTRADLNQYVQEQNLSGQSLKDFLNQTLNIRKLPTRPLAEVVPNAAPNSTKGGKLAEVALYQEPSVIAAKAEAEKLKQDTDKAKAEADKQAEKEKWDYLKYSVSLKDRRRYRLKMDELKAKPPAPPAPPAAEAFTVYTETADTAATKVALEKLPLRSRIKESILKPGRFNFANIPGEKSLLEDDVLFFNDGFVDETAEQITDALVALDQKKRAETNPSHVKIMVNSPGGSIWSGMDIRGTLNQMKIKTDVIVTGMAASCGAFLMASATGLRMATPNARIMIHDAWWSLAKQPDVHYNDRMDYLDRSTKTFVEAIATASGRPLAEVWEDMKIDVWLNPLESMFYGDKGLTDIILVGQEKAITKQDVRAYLNDVLGSPEAAQAYLNKRLEGLRSGNRTWRPEDHPENDPFENPLKTIQAVAKRAAKPLSEVSLMVDSLPRPKTTANYYVVMLPKGSGGASGTTRDLSAASQEILADLKHKWG